MREGIVEQARLSKEFDIAAAWVELEEPDESISTRVITARLPRQTKGFISNEDIRVVPPGLKST